jgi:hypothetical protein
MKVFEIDNGEQYLYAARSKERAIKLYKRDNKEENFIIREIPGNELISIIHVDEEGHPVETKTAREWAAQEGCFSTT